MNMVEYPVSVGVWVSLSV